MLGRRPGAAEYRHSDFVVCRQKECCIDRSSDHEQLVGLYRVKRLQIVTLFR